MIAVYAGQPGAAVFRDAVWRSRRLRPRARLVALALAEVSVAGRPLTTVSWQRLSGMTGLSPRRVRSGLGELVVDAGQVEVVEAGPEILWARLVEGGTR